MTFREDQLAGGVTITAGARARSSSRPISRSSRSRGRLVSLTQPPSTGQSLAAAARFPVARAGSGARHAHRTAPASRACSSSATSGCRASVARVEASPQARRSPSTSRRRPPRASPSEPGRLIVTFEADALDLALPSMPPPDFLQACSPATRPLGAARDGAEVRHASRHDVPARRRASSRLVIDLLPPTTEAPSPATPSRRRRRATTRRTWNPTPARRSDAAAFRRPACEPS